MAANSRDVFIRFIKKGRQYAVRVTRTGDAQSIEVFRKSEAGGWNLLNDKTAGHLYESGANVAWIFGFKGMWDRLTCNGCSFDYDAAAAQFVQDPMYGTPMKAEKQEDASPQHPSVTQCLTFSTKTLWWLAEQKEANADAHLQIAACAAFMAYKLDMPELVEHSRKALATVLDMHASAAICHGAIGCPF